MTEPTTARRLARDLSDLVDSHTHAAVLVNEAATYILAQEQALIVARDALQLADNITFFGSSYSPSALEAGFVRIREALKQIKELQ